jgi:hypothetical protein
LGSREGCAFRTTVERLIGAVGFVAAVFRPPAFAVASESL